jgi:DNA invertase Pin-like site-specific DNA recombinase
MNNTMQVIYARTSTADQKMERQLSKDKKAFIDVCSGSIPFAERPAAKLLLADKTITAVEVAEISRLGRNLVDILNTLKHFTDKGINLIIQNQGLNTMLPNGKKNPAAELIISMFGAVAAVEREMLIERTKQGVQIAQAAGKYKGRKRGTKAKEENIKEKYKHQIALANEKLALGQSLLSITNFLNSVEGLKISRATLIRLQQEGILIDKKKK